MLRLLLQALLFSPDRPVVQGIPRWLPASPAEAKALPCEGASALMTASVIAQVPLWVACTTWWEQTIAKQMITIPEG